MGKKTQLKAIFLRLFEQDNMKMFEYEVVK